MGCLGRVCVCAAISTLRWIHNHVTPRPGLPVPSLGPLLVLMGADIQVGLFGLSNSRHRSEGHPSMPMSAFLSSQIIASHHMQSISFASGGDTVRRDGWTSVSLDPTSRELNLPISPTVSPGHD